MKRWKNLLEVYDYELSYKPGRANVVADSLSRNLVNSTAVTILSDDSSGVNLIPTAENPINSFKNQLVILEGKSDFSFEIPFSTYHRHTIKMPPYSEEKHITILKKYLDPNLVNDLCTKEPIMGENPRIVSKTFSIVQDKIDPNRSRGSQNFIRIRRSHVKRASKSSQRGKREYTAINTQYFFLKWKGK